MATFNKFYPFVEAIAEKVHNLGSDWWDYGSAVTLASGDSFTVDFDAGTGVLTLV